MIFIWLLFGIGTTIAASNKNRSTVGWFFLGLLLGPFGLLFILLLPAIQKPAGNYLQPVTALDPPPDTKICPTCAEEIKLAALKCKHCGESFTPDQVATATAAYQAEFDRLQAARQDVTFCPRCQKFDVVTAFLGDGSFGPYCPNCKMPPQ
jgi:hypothetical protein